MICWHDKKQQNNSIAGNTKSTESGASRRVFIKNIKITYKSIILFTSSTFLFFSLRSQFNRTVRNAFLLKQFFDSTSYSFDIHQCTVCRTKNLLIILCHSVCYSIRTYIDYTLSSSLLFFVIVIVVLAVALVHTLTRSARFGSVGFFAWQNF